MDNVQNCDRDTNIPSSHTYRLYLFNKCSVRGQQNVDTKEIEIILSLRRLSACF
jgi:hypothetical protein